jgi:glyoxylase-like metal-dependent hydrolase (beta-lactamase superfamily II)
MLKTLIYPWESPPPAGEAIELAPQVAERTDTALLWIRMPLPFALNHINLWLMHHEGGWCAVDCGYGDETTRALWSQHFSSTMDGLPITQVVATHYHPDHLGNARWLMDHFKAPLAMSYAEFATAHALSSALGPYAPEAMSQFYRLHGLGEEIIGQIASRFDKYSKGVPTLPTQIHRVRPGEDLTLGGHVWRAIGGYGHTPEHIALYCDQLRVLISGDMLLPKISTNVNVWPLDPTADPVQQFLDSLDAFAALPDETLVLPSHGLPFRGIRPRVAALHAHHRERTAEMVAALDTPKTAVELIPILFRRELDLHQTFFAVAEAVAHVNHAARQGMIRLEVGDDGVQRGVRIA